MRLFVSVIALLPTLLLAQMKTGMWQGVLHLNKEKGIDLPFNFEVKMVNARVQLIIHNAQERILVDETFFEKETFNFKMPVFDTEFRTKIYGDTLLKGEWINHTKKENNTIAFTAIHNELKRFPFNPKKPGLIYNGKWEVDFNKNKPDTYKAIGLFTYEKGTSTIFGTFLTETGDYRYLEGMEHEGKLYLSCFDGSHAFLFTAENNGQSITNGHFYSGATGYESWEGRRNGTFELPNPEGLTYLKDTMSTVYFAFYNTRDSLVSLKDDKFKGKVVIIQLMGSWCPNCMDESAYLADLYERYQKKGLEIVALAYERTQDKLKAKANIERLVKRFHIGYEVLLTGLTGKDKASESMPFLNKIMAFPTTIILDKHHQVQTIYTGFNGPATGKAYNMYTQKTEALIEELLSK
jgi:thiol-disulfide isomerase/thioredoxin